ncbi:LPXTG cell wall anchor domain-containing protein [Streptomyces sp. NPDC003015]
MRTLTRFGVLSAVTSAAFLVAPVAHATAPGDNGTVKIHDATTGEELRKNEPHVCTFYLDAFGFDAVQEVDWHIEAWAPTAKVKGDTVKSGEITLDSDGHGRTEDLSLPDGHYKLFWNFDGEKGAAKHKVFWADCAEEEGGGGTATPSASASGTPGSGESASPSGEPGSEPSADPSSEPSGSAEAGASASASPSASASAQGSTGDLAETGNSAPVGLLAGVAAALTAAGGYLVVRRRRA